MRQAVIDRPYSVRCGQSGDWRSGGGGSGYGADAVEGGVGGEDGAVAEVAEAFAFLAKQKPTFTGT